MAKSIKMSSKDRRIYRHVLIVALFVSITIASFFVYDIVLDAKTPDEKETTPVEEISDVIIDVTEPVYKEPEKIVVSDKTVFLAHLTADRKDYTFPFLVDENARVLVNPDFSSTRMFRIRAASSNFEVAAISSAVFSANGT